MTELKIRILVFWSLGIWLLGTSVALAANDSALLSVEAYGNFHSGGVMATINGDDNDDAAASLVWRRQGEGSFSPGHPLTRIDETHFIGSLFWLDPGRDYEVKVTLSDPDGIAGESSSVAKLTTRPDVLAEPTLRTIYVASKGSSAENNAVSFTDDIGRGNVVRRNTIHGTFNGIGPCGSAAPPDGITNETDIYDNILYQHTDDAIEPEGYCANVRLWNNQIQDVHMAFAVAPAAPGPVYILCNITFRFENTRTSLTDGYTASALKINSGYQTPIGPLYLYHNTFLTDVPGTDAVALLNPGYSTFIKARNNIFAGTRYALYKVNPVILDWDRDNLYTTDSSRFVYWQGTRYDAFGDFKAATNQELNGIADEPGLSDPSAGDFTPTRAKAPWLIEESCFRA